MVAAQWVPMGRGVSLDLGVFSIQVLELANGVFGVMARDAGLKDFFPKVSTLEEAKIEAVRVVREHITSLSAAMVRCP